MNAQYFALAPERQRKRARSLRQWSTRNVLRQIEDGFLCNHCNNYVSATWFLSGVKNRNHCPYCLWSRHLDLYNAGDRLSACKSLMQPIGLTIKLTRKKFGPGRGELMLIHACEECHALSINRIAADDDLQRIIGVFEGSYQIGRATHECLEANDIRLLDETEAPFVHLQLFGNVGSNM